VPVRLWRDESQILIITKMLEILLPYFARHQNDKFFYSLLIIAVLEILPLHFVQSSG
jgi:hypothetical protein